DPLMQSSDDQYSMIGKKQSSQPISKSTMTAEPLSPQCSPIQQNDEHDLYAQFDQLASSRQTKHEDNGSVLCRERIKSFIEFDDDPADFDDTEPAERSSNSSERRRSTKSTTSEYYKDDLINVFHGKQQSSESEMIEGEEDEEDDVSETESNVLYGRLNQMEHEQELLNNSLVALTSHFAQVQLRLRQIVEAKDIDAKKRETLLAELETFANRGIPELMLCTNPALAIEGGTSLQRSVSMATSLMADDVFEDEDNDGPIYEGDDHKRDDSISRDYHARSSWSCSQPAADYADSVHSGMTITSTTTDRTNKLHHSSTMLITEEKLERQRSRQKELISQLKDQLEDLERYAYETGELNSLPNSMLLERQNAIIEQLKSKLPILSIDEIDQLTPEQLRRKVDQAVKELVNPVIMKEQLVSQLKTQVTDLERFIQFSATSKMHYKQLYQQQQQQANGNMPFSSSSSSSYLMKFLSKNRSTGNEALDKQRNHNSNGNRSKTKSRTKQRGHNNEHTETAANIFKRILSLLHVFAWTQMGTCSNFTRYHQDNRIPFEQNVLKRTTASCARHWGDLRAQLEIAITSILDFYKEQNMNCTTISTNNASEESANFISLGNTTLVIDNYFAYEQVTIMVRKGLAIALRNLIHHGLIGHCNWNDSTDANGSLSLTSSTMATTGTATTIGQLISMGMGCFSSKTSPTLMSKTRPMHVWQLIIYYYELKNGSKFRSTPNRRLSQSFGLQSVTGHQTSPKHSLLAAIDDINDSHTRFKRNMDSHFKVFICRGLNQQMLSQWLRLILRNPTIVNECYEKWSYTASTGFEDALRQLDRLSNLRFCLPTDLAVRQLQSIHDAF
ncbi:RUN protein, partial [Dermatophagoides farinae]